MFSFKADHTLDSFWHPQRSGDVTWVRVCWNQLFVQIIHKSLLSIRLFIFSKPFQSLLIWNCKYESCSIFTIPNTRSSQWDEQTWKCHQPNVTSHQRCSELETKLYPEPSGNWNKKASLWYYLPITLSCFCCSTHGRKASLRDSSQFVFWSHVCSHKLFGDLMTVESLPQTFSAWSPAVLWIFFSVSSKDWHVKSGSELSVCVLSPTILKLVKIQKLSSVWLAWVRFDSLEPIHALQSDLFLYQQRANIWLVRLEKERFPLQSTKSV